MNFTQAEQEYKVVATFDASGERISKDTYSRVFHELSEAQKDHLLKELEQNKQVLEVLVYQRLLVQWDAPTGKRKGWIDV